MAGERVPYDAQRVDAPLPRVVGIDARLWNRLSPDALLSA